MFARTFKRSRDLVERGGGRREAQGRATCPRSRLLDSARAEPAAGRPARPRVRRKAVRRTRHGGRPQFARSEEYTSELQSLKRISYASFCLKKTQKHTRMTYNEPMDIHTEL